MKHKLLKMFNHKYEMAFFILLFLLSIILCFLPYFWKGTYPGLDSGYHLSRIQGLADMLKTGVFPVKLHSSSCFGYGYGTGFFYPNFFLYFPAALVALGLNLGTSAKILFFLTMTTTFLTGFYCTWKLTKNVYGSAIAGSLILLSPLMVNSTYYVFALGHVTAFPFIALSIVGLYLILERNEKPFMFILGFWGLFLTHSITMLMTFIVCAIMALCYSVKIIKTFTILKKLLFSVVLTVGLTTAYWLPMLEQQSVQKYKISQPWTVASENVPGFEVFAAVQNGPGIVVTICLAICISYTIWNMIKKKNIQKIDLLLTGIATLLSIIAISQWFWNIFQDVFNFIQYPFRLFYMVTVLVSIECGIIISRIKAKNFIVGMITVFIFVINVSYVYVSLESIFKEEREFFVDRKLTEEVAGIGSGQEWLPIDCSGSNFNESQKAIANDGSGADGTKEEENSIFNVYVLLEKEYYDMPYVYYYGYQAELTEEDGTVTALNVGKSVDMDGKLRVYLPEGKQGIGVITVTYQMTLLQKLSYVISGVFFIFVAVISVRYILSEKKKKAALVL